MSKKLEYNLFVAIIAILSVCEFISYITSFIYYFQFHCARAKYALESGTRIEYVFLGIKSFVAS